MLEKPWYYSALVAFIRDDLPSQLDISPAETSRDLAYLEKRLTCEGESFLTVTLPKLGKDIDLCLQGHIPLTTLAFKRASSRRRYPAFLRVLFGRVFSCTGWVLENPCITSIRLLRQVCYWFKKIEKGFSDETLQKAVNEFIEVDRQLPTEENLFLHRTLGTARAIIDSLFPVFPGLDRLRPKHGPGAVASGGDPVEKRMWGRYCFDELEAVFKPYHFFYSQRSIAENYERISGRMHCAYGLSRTEFVEKDSSGPRTIGLEPAEYMWCQQALKGYLYSHVEKHPLTRGQINFTDQTINRELTRSWSEYETLDMSKASDRNSLALVKFLFKNTWMLRYLLACRTPGTLLPDGQILWYKKFAPMGSAVCFPIEAIVFYSIAVAVLHDQGVPLLVALKQVFVYGDDIIVPRGYFPALTEAFEAVGLKFNPDKCCIHGKFRESCGLDAFDAQDVTPVRFRKAYPRSQDANFLIPIIKHINNLSMVGYGHASRSLRKEALARFPKLRKLKLPTSDLTDLPILYWHSSEAKSISFINKHGGMTFVKGWVFKPLSLETRDAWEGHFLLESLSRGGPVGRLIRPGGNWFRVLDRRFVGSLVRKRLSYVRTM